MTIYRDYESTTPAEADEDLFGALFDEDEGDEDADVFGGEVDADEDTEIDAEVDQDLAALESEFDAAGAADLYGTDPLVRGDDAPARATTTGDALARAFEPDMLEIAPAEWIRGFLPDMLEPDVFKEARDMAAKIVTVPGFDRWSQDPTALSMGEKGAIVNEAIFQAAWPGNYPDAPARAAAAIEEAWNTAGIFAKIAALGGGYKEVVTTFWRDDVWPVIKSVMPFTDEQVFNQLAYAYWAGHKVAELIKAASSLTTFTRTYGFAMADYYDKYDEIIADIDAAIAAGAITTAPAYTPAPVPAWPAEEIAPSDGFSLPRPQTILAVGYAATVAAALLGH